MENDILDSLEDLGYQGPVLEVSSLQAALSGGAASPEFTKLCAWLVSELKLYCRLEETVHATNCPSEAEGFQLEMSGLLTELNCPYSSLTCGDVTKRLLNANNCQLLLSFLISELEAARMYLINNPQKSPDGAGKTEGSEVFLELKGICVALGMSKPPSNITMFQFFSGIEKKLKEALSKVSPNHVGEPLLKKPLGPFHWEKIEVINQALVNEYDVRRKMLLKRLDVTVQSFGWSDRAKTHSDKLNKVYPPLRASLAAKCRVCVAHLLAARDDLSKILRTSSGQTREKTSCAINKILMGRVPDRGGRPNEIEPPPPEMPTWQKRQDGPTGGGGGRGGGGGGRGGYEQYQGGRGGGGRGDRGGKVQGGWSEGGSQGYYQDGGRGGHHGGQRGHQAQGGGGYQGGGYQGGGYQGGGYQGGQQGQVYNSGGYQGGQQVQGGGNKSHYQDGGRQQDRGGRGGRGGGGRGRGARGGWGGRGGQNLNQGGQFEQFFQQGGQQYNQAGFGQGFYSS